MLTSGASTLLEPALTGLSHSGAANLLTDCRLWQSQALGASSGSAVFDTCSLGTVSITEQQPLSSYVTDDYFLVFADMCGDGEIITQINAAPANGGWAGLEVREDMASSARKFGLRTQTSTIVQPFIRSTAGQAITLLSFIKPPHQWLKVSRSGDYFTAYTSSDGNFWFFVYAAVLPLPECVKAGVYTQSLYVGAPATALFNQVTITDNSPATAVNFADSTLTAGSDTTLAHCGDEARLGGRFCMLSDVEITYTWDAEGQVIGEYTVVNDSIAIITGNIDTSTHELVITPGTTAEYVLRRTISDFGGLPNDFALCAETDTVTVTVLQAPPSPGFTFVVNEDSCQVQFTSLDTTGTHLWDFGDTGSSSAANPLHTYSGSGPFSVVHTISNECGAFDTTQVVNINCCTAPTLTITATHDGCGNVNFSATATGDNPTLVSYDWAFGDDATDTAAAPSHTYAGEGTYIASLTTVNDCGEQASATDTLTIDFPETPDATFTISIDTCSGRVDFTAAPGQEANGHLWAFGDAGNHTDQGVGLTAVSFTYPTPGTYTVSHTVDEPTCGASDLATATFTIPALPPVGDPSQVFTTHLGCNEVEFQLRDSLGGTLFFGDGASVIADTAYIYHTYSEAADYTATYTLGSGCAQDSFSFIVKLAQYAPQAEAQLTDTFCLGVVVSSADTIAGYGYQWQFGASGPVAGAQAAFTFDSSGLYSIILTVSDTCGNSASDTLQVAVQDCAEALSCPCKNGVNIVADSINGTRLSTLTALGILPPGLLANTCLAVSGLLLIDEDYDISGGEVYMHPGSEIGVGLGSEQVTFAISAMWQSPGVQGCGQMWKGIRVGDDSRLVLKGARIADAQYAIHALNKSTILVNESFFNRNYTSLYFDATGSATFSLEAFLGTEVLGYEALLPPFAGQSPAPGARPYAGISLRHGQGMEPKRVGGLGTDTGQQNRFEGLRNGILAENTPLAVHNSAFADIETAAAEPYPFTGFGIRHTGGAAHPLLQRGRGASRTDGPSFHNCTRAIWAEGASADIANNYMTACGYGVQVQLAQNRQVSVNNNRMEVSRTGIDLLSNAPLPILEVAGNDIATTSRGINVEETGIAFADAAIRSNTVTLAGKGFGLRLRGVNGLEASSNDIYMEQAVQTAAGIRVNGATNCTVRENYVAGPGPDNLFFVGLDVLDGSNSVFDCNTFTELGTGAEFEGSCMGSRVSTNVFEPSELGMGRGLVYRANLNIGQQSYTGNLWEINSSLPDDGYEQGAAVNYDSDINLGIFPNRFEVNDNVPPYYPISFSFPNIAQALQQAAEEAWFPIDGEGVADTCFQNGGLEPTEVKDIHLKVARGEQLDEDYPGAMLWAAQLQLYRELNLEEWPANEILDSFYLANDTTLLSVFYQLEKGRDSLYKLSLAESAQLQQWGEELDSLISFILKKDSLIATGVTGLENARDSLLDKTVALCTLMDSLENIILQARISFAGTLLAANSALSDTAVYQTNEKLSSKLFLNTIAQASSAFDAQQAGSLLSIAGQCPLSGGRAVHYARSLYQLVADSTFVDVCEAGSERVASGLQINFEKEGSGLRIYPNPTSGELVVEGYCRRIDVVSQLGQPVWSRSLPEGKFQHFIDLQDLPGGIYFLQAWLQSNRISQAKLVISK